MQGTRNWGWGERRVLVAGCGVGQLSNCSSFDWDGSILIWGCGAHTRVELCERGMDEREEDEVGTDKGEGREGGREGGARRS